MPGGATPPNQVIDRKSGIPDSANVGTFGSALERCAFAMATILALPARCNGSDVTIVSNIILTWPATMSVSAGPAPR